MLSTATLNDELKAAKNVEDYLKRNEKNMITCRLSDYLNQLLFQKDMRSVVSGSQLDTGYVYQIFPGRKTPSWDKLIAIAFGLSLSESETQKLLKVSGNRELYVRDQRDALILFSLQRKMPIYEANELLDDYGFKLLL